MPEPSRGTQGGPEAARDAQAGPAGVRGTSGVTSGPAESVGVGVVPVEMHVPVCTSTGTAHGTDAGSVPVGNTQGRHGADAMPGPAETQTQGEGAMPVIPGDVHVEVCGFVETSGAGPGVTGDGPGV